MRLFSKSRLWSVGLLLGSLFAAYPATAQNVSLFIANTIVLAGANYDVSSANAGCRNSSNAPGDAGPIIEFEQPFNSVIPADIGTYPSGPNCPSPWGDNSYPTNAVNLCVCLDHSSSVTTVDSLEFDVFKFQANTNPLDTTSAPPLRTYFLFNLGDFNLDNGIGPGSTGDHESLDQNPCAVHLECVTWDGFYNIQGEYGKSDGQFGFRATVSVNQTNPTVGNVNISNVAAYPSSDGCVTAPLQGLQACNGPATNGDGPGIVNPTYSADSNEFPINVDVVDIHALQSTPTVVGKITAVAAEPYNFLYRLSKDSLMTIQIFDPIADPNFTQPVRNLIPGLPRVGEGTPSGGLTNGDFWDGRDDYGNIVSSGVYDARFNAESTDIWGQDFAYTIDRAVALDPLQITDVSIAPLTNSDTALAVLNYTLTEPATVYVDIWSPDAVLNTSSVDGQYNIDNPAANLQSGTMGIRGTLEARIVQYQTARSNQITFWNGYTNSGTSSPVPLPDGNYVFAINAELQSADFQSPTVGKTIQNSKPQIGFVPVERGLVGISQIAPATGVFGSTPPVAGIPPYLFGYQLSRDALVTMQVTESSSPATVIKTLVSNEIRAGGQLLVERWNDGITDDGTYPSSGTYTVWLYAQDTLFSNKITTTSAQFPIDIFRVANVQTSPLLGGTSSQATLSYILSQPMNITWNIYPPGTRVPNGPGAPWPPIASQITSGSGGLAAAKFTLTGVRPGQTFITESWNGYDANSLYVPDGQYIYTFVAQSTTTPAYYATDKVVGSLTVARGQVGITSFNVIPTFPSVTGSSQTVPVPPYELAFTLTRQSSVTLNVYDTNIPPHLIRNVVSGEVDAANVLNTDFWDGRDTAGNFVPEAFYNAQLIANDVDTTLANPATAQQTISVNPLRIYDVTVAPLAGTGVAGAQMTYQLSEAMKVSLKIFKPSTTFDASGNPSPPESVSLLKRIVGERPSRQTITETWDGTDLMLTLVPDGDYPFSLVASPNASSIDSTTGDVAAGATLASDIIVSDVPISRSASINPKADFENNSIIYPNPSKVTVDPFVHFRIRVPIQATVSLNIYTLSGDKVLSLGEGQFASESSAGSACGSSDSYCDYNWSRANSGGRQVAPGVYFAVIREQTTLGARSVYQMVKKLLLQ